MRQGAPVDRTGELQRLRSSFGKMILGSVIFYLGTVSVSWSAGEGAGGEGGWKDLFFRLVNFAVLAGLIYYLLAGKVKAFFAERQESIKKTMEEADKARAQAEQRYKEAAGRLAEAEGEIERLSELIRAQGIREREKLISEAREIAGRMKSDLEARMEQEYERAEIRLRAEAVAVSLRLAEGLLKREITREDQESLIRDYLKKAACNQ